MTPKKGRPRRKKQPPTTTALAVYKPPPKRRNWKPAFILALSNTCNVRASCDWAQIARQTAYYHRSRDPRFRAQWDEALTEAVEVLELECRSRALKGSDILLMFLLKAHKREMYQDRVAVEFNVKEQARALAEKNGIDPDELIRVAQQIADESQRAGADR